MEKLTKKQRHKIYKNMLNRNRWVGGKDMLFRYLEIFVSNSSRNKDQLHKLFPELGLFNEPVNREIDFKTTIKTFRELRSIALLFCIEMTKSPNT